MTEKEKRIHAESLLAKTETKYSNLVVWGSVVCFLVLLIGIWMGAKFGVHDCPPCEFHIDCGEEKAIPI